MRLRFDSGLVIPKRTAIRTACVASLTDLLISSGTGYLSTILELPAPIRFGDPEDEHTINDLVSGRSPSVGIALGTQRFQSDSPDGTSLRGRLTVSAYVMVRQLRSVMAGVAGDVAEVGVEPILEHLLERLSGIQVVDDGVLVLDTEEPLLFGVDWQIWEQQYQVRSHYEINRARNGTLIKSVSADHIVDGSPATPVRTITTLEGS